MPQDIPPPRLHARDLQFAYPGGEFSLHLPELTLPPGQVLRLSGPSGAGKSTLLRLLCGLLPLTKGAVTADARHDLHRLSPAALRAWRLRHAGLVFQDFALLDYLTAAENILLPSRFDGLTAAERSRLLERLPHLARRLEVTPLLARATARLSQGERQRVAVLRALVGAPGLVFADEPTASLDRRHRDQVLALLDEHRQETGAAVVLITHDPEVAGRYPAELNLEDLRAS